MATVEVVETGHFEVFEVKMLQAIEKKESMVQALKQCPQVLQKQEILNELAELEGWIADECAAELLAIEHAQFLEHVKKVTRKTSKKRILQKIMKKKLRIIDQES